MNQSLSTNTSFRRPALWSGTICPLQRPLDHPLAPRRLETELHRRHAGLRVGGAARGTATQVGQLLLQEALRPRWVQGAARVAGRPGLTEESRGCQRRRRQEPTPRSYGSRQPGGDGTAPRVTNYELTTYWIILRSADISPADVEYTLLKDGCISWRFHKLDKAVNEQRPIQIV